MEGNPCTENKMFIFQRMQISLNKMTLFPCVVSVGSFFISVEDNEHMYCSHPVILYAAES